LKPGRTCNPDEPARGVRPLAVLALTLLVVLGACGYRLAGKGSTLPEHVRRIAVPLFENETRQPDIAQRITEEVADEFIRRGGYTTTSSPENAEALLTGTVLVYRRNPVGIGEEGRATRYEIEIQINAELQDLVNDVVLWKDDHFVFRDQYDVDPNESEFFDESIVAIEEVSRDLARSVVATILEGF
jgi:outer membrane lipopolysaccharide assembly protein LptE/RlpB